jgi:hypothetical protein
MENPETDPAREQEARRVTAEHAKAREANKQAVAKKNEEAHKAAVKARHRLDRVKAAGLKGLEF